MSAGAEASNARTAFERLLGELRPKLHRYCARMSGSVIDGEDVLQEALIKAIEAYPAAAPVANPEGWLFRIAHNAALDFLRRRARMEKLRAEEDPDMIVDAVSAAEQREIAAASLRTFMRLPVAQRSSVILMDVLGYSLGEIGGVTEMSVPAIKAALHRGRQRLRELAREPDDLAPPAMSDGERERLDAYINRFNARDFDAVRAMLAEDVRLELVGWKRLDGRREVAKYFSNYSRMEDWHFVPGFVDRQPALLMRDPRNPTATPKNFVLLAWTGEDLSGIRDFRHAPYAIDGAEIVALD